MKLTDAAIRALKPRRTRYEVWDDDVKCFGVRVTPNGTKSFTFFYRLGGRKKKRLNLGEFPAVGLADARAKANSARGTIKGEHRQPEIRTRATEHSADGLTVSDLCTRYLASDRFKTSREATRHQFNRIVQVEIRPPLGDRLLTAIAPADLADWAQGIIDRGAPVTATQSFKILRLIWNWGRKRSSANSSRRSRLRGSASRGKGSVLASGIYRRRSSRSSSKPSRRSRGSRLCGGSSSS